MKILNANCRLLAVLLLLVLEACTDYASKMEDDFEEWKISQQKVPPETVEQGVLQDSRDGQIYKTISIGAQIWMAENLNYETSNSFCYEDNVSNCAKYGRLYTWAAAMDSAGTWSVNGKGCGYGKACSPTYPVRGVCPEDWHLPTETEWNTLFSAVGGSSMAGKILKSTSGCNNVGNGTDSYAFLALPAGIRDDSGIFVGEGSGTVFWSSTERKSDYANLMYLDCDYDAAFLDYNSMRRGHSVRCVKDENSSSITPQSSSSRTRVSSSSVKSSSSVALSGSTKSSSSEKAESSSSKVTEPAEVTSGTMTDSRDGQTYKTVTIGTQTWMAQNLNYETANSYCYDDNASYCTKYGRLYTWAAAMDSAGTWSMNGKGCGYDDRGCSPRYPVRGVCPEGWHLPTEEEFETLFTAVGGKSIAGQKLKSVTGWTTKSGITNEDAFAFSALPAGYRNDYGDYSYEGDYAYFWSSTQYLSNGVYIMLLGYNNGDANLGGNHKFNGFSVRCLKD